MTASNETASPIFLVCVSVRFSSDSKSKLGETIVPKMSCCSRERVKYVGNDVYMWEMASVFEKRLKYEGNDVDFWEMAQICGELA